MTRTIICRSLQAPCLNLVMSCILREILVEWVRKSDPHASLNGFQCRGHIGWLARVSNAIKPTGLMLGSGPGKHPRSVKLTIPGMKSPAHDACWKLRNRQFTHATLCLPLYQFVRHRVYFTVTIGQVQQHPIQSPPLSRLSCPEKLRGLTVKTVGDPTQRLFHGFI